MSRHTLLASLLILGVAARGTATEPSRSSFVETWTEKVGGGWEIDNSQSALTHGTLHGRLFQTEGTRRRLVDTFVYDAKYFPSIDCAVYGTTREGVQIFAACGKRAPVLLVAQADDWKITSSGLHGPPGFGMSLSDISAQAGGRPWLTVAAVLGASLVVAAAWVWRRRKKKDAPPVARPNS